MKKLMSILVVAILALGFAPSVLAAGAITAAEQGILNELNAGVTAGGGTFYFAASDITQAENAVKSNDYSDASSQTVVGHIQAARKLVVDNSKGITATSLTNLLGQLPVSVRNEINNHIAAAASALGLVYDASTRTISDKSGKTVIIPNTKSNPVVKATGADYTTSFAVFALLMIAALGAAVVGKKYSVA